MKVLLDACIARSVARELRELGFDVSRVVEIKAAMADEDVLGLAAREERVLVTEDSDFGRLVVKEAHANSGVIRFVDVPARLQARMCHELLVKYMPQLAQGAIIRADLTRVRVRLSQDIAEN